jgi:TatD DNase family protein
MFIDTHTHLYADTFSEDRDLVIQTAIEAGVTKMLLPNIDKDSIEGMFALEQKYPANCFPMMGLHPGSVSATWKEDLAVIETHLFSRNVIAVGEIGMDLYWDKTYQKEQAEAFRMQVQWAKKLNLPIVIHAREAFDEIFEILDELNDDSLKGVFHCFTGTVEQAAKINAYGGFKLGIGGVLTYKKAGLDEVLKSIPLEMMILETDSPYLPPTPHRGKRNESAYLVNIAEKLADVKQVPLREVAQITTLNATHLFKLT